MATSFASGMVSGGVRGYKRAKFYHADIWTGNLDKSLDYIMETEYGRAELAIDYGINQQNDLAGNYHVARRRNLRDGYTLKKGTIISPEGEKLGAITINRKVAIDKKILSDVYVTRKTVKQYFYNRNLSMAEIGHEMIHAYDFYHGYDFYTKSPKLFSYYSEYRAYTYSYLLTGNNFYLNQADKNLASYLLRTNSTWFHHFLFFGTL